MEVVNCCMVSDADLEVHKMRSTTDLLLAGTLLQAFAMSCYRGKCVAIRKLAPDRAHSRAESCCPPIHTGTREN